MADLAPGRPWHAATWAYLITQLGFTDVESFAGPATDGLGRADGDDATAAALNRALERLEPLVCGPESFCVIGTKRQAAAKMIKGFPAPEERQKERRKKRHRAEALSDTEVAVRPVRIDQVVPSFGGRDAIGAHILHLRDLLRDLGFESDVWCKGAFPETRSIARFTDDLPDRERPGTWWLYHLSSGSPVAELIAERPEPKMRRLSQHHAGELVRQLGSVGDRRGGHRA